MHKLWGIRVDEPVETGGLDVHEHGMWGYPEFYIPVPGGYGTESHGHLGVAHANEAGAPCRRPRRGRRRGRHDEELVHLSGSDRRDSGRAEGRGDPCLRPLRPRREDHVLSLVEIAPPACSVAGGRSVTLDSARILVGMHSAPTIAMQLRTPKANFVALINAC